ncbi:uncharacterized protein LOC144337685 [Macaca mulatta]
MHTEQREPLNTHPRLRSRRSPVCRCRPGAAVRRLVSPRVDTLQLPCRRVSVTERKEIFGSLDGGTGKEEPSFFGKLAAVTYGKLKSLSHLILCIFILDLLKKIKRQALPLLSHSIDERRQWSSPPPPQAWNLTGFCHFTQQLKDSVPTSSSVKSAGHTCQNLLKMTFAEH